MSAIAFELPPEVREACNGLTAFARSEVIPRHEQFRALLEDPRKLYREDGRFSDEAVAIMREVRKAAARAGFYTMCVPEALGGGGLGHLAYYAGWEHLFRLCGPLNWLMLYAISHWAFGPSRLLEKVTDEARRRILEPMNAGDASMCFGLSEPGAGSDAAALATRAVPHGDGWKISGRKIWTTNAPVADYCIVFAQTNPSLANARKGGISAFLVPTSSPGFEVQRIIPLFGNIGGDEAELRLDEVFVEPWQLVGELDRDSTRRYTAFRWDASTIRLARWDTGDGHLSSHWNIRKCAKRSGIRSRSIRA